MKSPMTVKSHKFLQEELIRLKSIERPKASKAIEIARAHGDLSENAEYDAAKEAQGMLEARIRDIEGKLSTAQVIDISKLNGEKVVFGATVTLEDADSGEEKVISIVGDDEVAVERGLISYQSPMARSVIGRMVGDLVKVKLPSGEKHFEIMDVQFKEL
jgi:transcription elongation factor GreA